MDIESIRRNGAIKKAVSHEISTQPSVRAESELHPQQRFEQLWDRFQALKQHAKPMASANCFTTDLDGYSNFLGTYAGVVINFSLTLEARFVGLYPTMRTIAVTPLYQGEPLPVERLSDSQVDHSVNSPQAQALRKNWPGYVDQNVSNMLGKLEESAEATQMLLSLQLDEFILGDTAHA